MNAPPRPTDRADRVPMTDAELAAFIAALPPCPGLPATAEEEAESDRRALQDIAAGRVYPHSLVAAWLADRSGTKLKPFREWLAERDG